METSTNTKVVLKAGIPLAITFAGIIFAKLATRKCSILSENSHGNHRDGEGSFSSVLDSLDTSCSDFDQNRDELKEEIMGLRNQIQVLQEKELELETRFLHYNYMKDEEILLLEIKNKFLLEICKIDFLEREISLVEEEKQRFEKMVYEIIKIMEMIEVSRSENKLLRRRVKKLLKKIKEQSCVIKDKCLKIEAKEEESSRNYEELEKRDNFIRKMEEEIQQLKMNLKTKQFENNELLNQIELFNNKAASSSKVHTFNHTLLFFSNLYNSNLKHLVKLKRIAIVSVISF